MKTTVEIPDELYRRLKSQAALEGRTIKAFLLDAVKAKLGDAKKSVEEPGWKAVFGKADKQDMADLQRIIDEEFSQIDYASWGLPDPNQSS